MYVSYKDIPNSARVWIYQSNRKFTQEEVEVISAKAILFLEQWTKHGEDLKGSFMIKYNQFIVIALDENFNPASGCSIDASVRFIQSLEQDHAIDLMDKMNISFKELGSVNTLKLSDFEKFVKDKKINEETIVFNNMIQTKGDFEHKWEVSIKDSWHSRFL